MFDDDPKPVGLEDDVAFETSLLDEGDLSQLPEAELIESSDEVGGSSIIQPHWVGKRFGRFRLKSLLGEGSMGRIILAEDVNLHRNVALKILRKRIRGMESADAVQQFLREARAAAQIDHPNVVRIYEINEHDGWWYIAMELVEGETLAKVIRATGALPAQRACPIIADAASALVIAHEMGIVHHDIKPSNLIITRRGRCKVTDFGLVRMDVRADPFDVHQKSVGTPKFMAPEVIRRRDQTTAVDIYSLGATLYFALTGWPPFQGTKTREILRKHLRDPAPDVRELAPDCPDSLAELIARMLEKAPTDRPTAEEVAAVLNAEAIDGRNDDWSWQGNLDTATATGRTSRTDVSSVEDLPTVHLSGPVGWTGRKLSLLIGGALALIAIVLAIAFWPGNTNPPTATSTDWSELFPLAPSTYGERATGDWPVVPAREGPPSFSWKTNPPAGVVYVADVNGRYYYKPGDSRAENIPAHRAKFFYTDAEAEQSKWEAAPD